MEPGSGSLGDLEDQGMDRSIVHEEAEERREMISSLRKGDWNSMLEFLKQYGSRSSIVHPVSTEFKDTIVHAAAALGQTEVVKTLLVGIKEMNLEMSLGVLLANQLGNNPLHSAALMGQVDTLRVIFEEVPELASARNIYGETPIFQAAVSGSKQVFSVLASMLPPDTKDIITMLRRNDGDTILHCALSGEYFDLANDILERFSQLVYYRNGRGLTPLHILANNPSGFKSGCQLGLLNHLLYSSIKVPTRTNSDVPTEIKQENGHRELAGDHKLNVTVANFWEKTFAALDRRRPLRKGAQSNDTQTSEPRPSAKDHFFKHLSVVLELIVFSLVLILFTPILALLLILTLEYYVIRILAWPVILAVEGFMNRRATIQNLKKKHIWANEVTEKILENIKQWQDFSEMNSGMDPYRYQLEWTRRAKPGTEQLQGDETITALLQEKEIPSAFETNFIQKNKKIASTVSHPSDPTSSSLPPANSYMSSSSNGTSFDRTREEPKRGVIESPFLIAGRMGIIEMVQAILVSFPMAINDKDLEDKNIMLLAAEHRHFYFSAQFLGVTSEKYIASIFWFGSADAEGNSLLHLAAKYPDNQGLLTGATTLMWREVTWFNFFKKNLPPYFSTLRNHKGQTAIEVFTETHRGLAIQRAKWLREASQSCSVVATLIISVVFATNSTVPGGLLQDKGAPVYRGKLAFNIFSMGSLFAMCFSSISLIMFLGILTSPYQEFDVGNDLPKKLLYGLASLFISITAMFLSFFSGVLFVLESNMKYIAYPTFILTSCVAAFAAFPLYFKNVKPMVFKIPTSTSRN